MTWHRTRRWRIHRRAPMSGGCLPALSRYESMAAGLPAPLRPTRFARGQVGLTFEIAELHSG